MWLVGKKYLTGELRGGSRLSLCEVLYSHLEIGLWVAMEVVLRNEHVVGVNRWPTVNRIQLSSPFESEGRRVL